MSKKKRAQVFIEFFLIFLVGMIAFLLFLIVGIKYLDSLKEKHDLESMESISTDFKMRALIASQSTSDFSSIIVLPDKINDKDYDVYLENSVLIFKIIGEDQTRTVLEMLPSITGIVQKGCNLLMKDDDGLKVEPIPC